jgi:hypothetical protein
MAERSRLRSVGEVAAGIGIPVVAATGAAVFGLRNPGLMDSLAAGAESVGPVLPTVVLGGLLFLFLLTTPAANVLNVVTVPLGYEIQSCPYCPEVGIEKITYTDCTVCGTEIAENFSAGTSPSGDSELHHVCEDCTLDEAREVLADE